MRHDRSKYRLSCLNLLRRNGCDTMTGVFLPVITERPVIAQRNSIDDSSKRVTAQNNSCHPSNPCSERKMTAWRQKRMTVPAVTNYYVNRIGWQQHLSCHPVINPVFSILWGMTACSSSCHHCRRCSYRYIPFNVLLFLYQNHKWL